MSYNKIQINDEESVVDLESGHLSNLYDNYSDDSPTHREKSVHKITPSYKYPTYDEYMGHQEDLRDFDTDYKYKPEIEENNKNLDMYSLLENFPETKVTFEELRDRSLKTITDFTKETINKLEAGLFAAPFNKFSYDEIIDVSEFDMYGISKIINIIKWFYEQRKFSVDISERNRRLKIRIIWGIFAMKA